MPVSSWGGAVGLGVANLSIVVLLAYVLLPLFFVVTGLKTRVGLIDRPELWLITGLLMPIQRIFRQLRLSC